MDDQRVWAFEESLWTADRERYAALTDDDILMVLPQPPYVFSGKQAVDAVADTPRWEQVEFSEQQVMRPQEGLIVIGYHVSAERGEERYEAHCTSTLRRREHDDWQVVQHQQTPPLAMPTKA